MNHVMCVCVWIGEVGAEESKSFNFSVRYETYMGQLSLRSYHSFVLYLMPLFFFFLFFLCLKSLTASFK